MSDRLCQRDGCEEPIVGRADRAKYCSPRCGRIVSQAAYQARVMAGQKVHKVPETFCLYCQKEYEAPEKLRRSSPVESEIRDGAYTPHEVVYAYRSLRESAVADISYLTKLVDELRAELRTAHEH